MTPPLNKISDVNKPKPAAEDIETRPTSSVQFVQPPSVLLMGATGSGKTWALSTVVEHTNLDLFVIITEPNGLDTLLDVWHTKKLPIERLHWHYVAPRAAKWDALKQMAKTVNTNSYEDLTKLKQGVAKKESTQFYEVLEQLENFTDDRTGESFGDVTEWTADTNGGRCLAIDSLSGLNMMAMAMTIGLKPVAHQGEWGTAMNLEEQLFLTISSSLKVPFILTAHIDKEADEISGAQTIQAAALGRKLAPRLTRFFSEVVLASRGKSRTDFSWSTADVKADLKNRGLEFSSSLAPDFALVWQSYLRRLATSGAAV